MEKTADLENKNWGLPCPECRGSGKNAVGGKCMTCAGLGQVSPDPSSSDFVLRETFRERIREQIPVKRPRIDFRGRAGPIKYARMKDLARELEIALDELLLTKAAYAKGAEMRVRLILLVRGPDLEQEKPELYERANATLTRLRAVTVGA
jgi:hypothetical protein